MAKHVDPEAFTDVCMGETVTAESLLGELVEDLQAHERLEGEAADFRNRDGMWEDVIDRVRQIQEAL